MEVKRIALVVPVLALLAAACGGGGGTQGAGGNQEPPAATSPASPEPNCSPSGEEIHVEAKGVKFTDDCLAAPADTPFMIHFVNSDAGVMHNVAIENSEVLFDGEVFAGVKTVEYEVPALPAGTYSFYCKVHPTTMRGTFVVE